MTDKKLDQGSWNIYQRKRWWEKKYTKITGDPLPDICPLSDVDNRHPPEYNTIEDAKNEINTARRCKMYNLIDNLVRDSYIPTMLSVKGRCDNWRVFTDCPVFRGWLKGVESGFVMGKRNWQINVQKEKENKDEATT